MKMIYKIAGKIAIAAFVALSFTACQKMDRPALAADYPTDANEPGGPLNFYAAFDGTTTDARMNAVDSIRATFASDNPLTSVQGVSGMALQGENKKFVKYAKPNDWAVKAESFTIAFWYKKDGQTKNNAGGNGPEYIFSFKSNNGHWSGANGFVFLEGNNTAAAIKVMFVDAAGKDNWFTWESAAEMIPGLLNNQWHHMALVYNAATSTMTLYIDGVANPNVKTWANHGKINIDDSKITEFRVGAGPNNSFDSDDWLSSSFKGNIDQLRFYSTALSVGEINTLYTTKQ
jgi:hypothetical protein